MIVNDKMPEYCVERAMKILNRQGMALSKSKVLVLGIAYKQDIDDYRESPAIDVIEILNKNGASVEFYDPYIPEYKHRGEKLRGIDKIDGKIISEYDLIIITASHSNIDYNMINDNAKAIFDTKNAMKHISIRDKIEVL